MKKPPRSLGVRLVQAKRSFFAKKVMLPLDNYIHNETISGAFLLIAAVIALLWSNLVWSKLYFDLQKIPILFQVGNFLISEDFKHWVNDGLMALFFFVVALEIKRELLFGELSTLSKAALPLIGALGGMILPATIYLIFNWQGEGMGGWGIPMATDIAFAIAVLGLIGDRIPQELRILLLTYAIIDDIGSILVIAFFYTETISLSALGFGALFLVVIIGLCKIGFRNNLTYVILGLLFWGAILKSGVHATIAGVILGFITPSKPFYSPDKSAKNIKRQLPKLDQALEHDDEEKKDLALGRMEELTKQTEAPLERLERLFHPPVSFIILPLFALLNAGVKFSGDLLSQSLSSSITLGIVIAFLIGKPLGISGAMGLAVYFGIAKLPKQVKWNHIIGMSLLGGIGFTVALFISNLAFTDETQSNEAKVGILAASFTSAVAGFSLLQWEKNKKKNKT